MEKKEIYKELLEKYDLNKEDAITFMNYRIGVALDKGKMLEVISSNIDKLKILCDDLKMEVRLHKEHPLFIVNNKQFYTTQEAAEILGMSTGKIRQLISEGKLSCKTINQRNWKIPNWSLEAYKNDLFNFLNSHEEAIIESEVVDIVDSENQLMVSLITKEGIHLVFEHETRRKRRLADWIPKL